MLDSKKLRDTLKTTRLFAYITDDVFEAIEGKVEQIQLPARTVLFQEGEVGDALYLIVEGRLAIRANGLDIATRGPGECVGELALLDEFPRSATVIAESNAFLLKLRHDDFYRALTMSWEVVRAAFRSLGQKLREEIERHIAIIRDQEQFQQDLRRAYEIQTAMLPSEDLMLDWVHLTGKSQPATIVGGDYYDYFRLPDGSISVAIGDVAGHGFYSSLLVATVSSALRFQLQQTPDPLVVYDVLNRVVQNYHHTRLLMSFSYIVIDPVNSSFSFVSAGHPYPYLYRHAEKKWTALVSDSAPLGTFLDDAPRTVQTTWEPGDRMFLYSDGLTETQNEQGQMYGIDLLEPFLNHHASLPPRQMISTLYETLDTYRQRRPFDDDVTVVVVQFL